MPIKVTCPKCGGVLHAPDDAGGKRGRCPTCATVLAIPAEDPAATPSGGPPSRSSHAGGLRPSPAPAGGRSAETAAPFGSQAATPFADVKNMPPAGGTYAIADADARRSSTSQMQGPSRDVPEPRRPLVPPTRQQLSAPAPTDDPTEVTARGWRRVRAGLSWERAGTSLLVLAVLAPVGVAMYEHYVGPLPNQTPGYLGRERLSSVEEVRFGSALVPATLGVLFVVLGRLLFSGAPRASYARGMARVTALATLVAVAGLAAAVVPVVKQVMDGNGLPDRLADPGTTDGLLQRLGLAAAVGFAVAAEAWFVVALGKMGAALGSRPASARSGRLVTLAGLLVGLGAVAAVGYREYPQEVNAWLMSNVQPLWDKVGEHKPATVAGSIAFATLLTGIVVYRLTGSVRRAARDWLALHPTA